MSAGQNPTPAPEHLAAFREDTASISHERLVAFAHAAMIWRETNNRSDLTAAIHAAICSNDNGANKRFKFDQTFPGMASADWYWRKRNTGLVGSASADEPAPEGGRTRAERAGDFVFGSRSGGSSDASTSRASRAAQMAFGDPRTPDAGKVDHPRDDASQVQQPHESSRAQRAADSAFGRR